MVTPYAGILLRKGSGVFTGNFKGHAPAAPFDAFLLSRYSILAEHPLSCAPESGYGVAAENFCTSSAPSFCPPAASKIDESGRRKFIAQRVARPQAGLQSGKTGVGEPHPAQLAQMFRKALP
jgi:hypothetical protein